MHVILLAAVMLLQGDSVYASPALRAIVGRAAVENSVVPPGLEGYRARVESEIALVDHRSTVEGAVQVEQVASEVRWNRTGAYEQHVIGYRARTLGPNVSVLTYFRRAWTVPVLYGNRLALFFGPDSSEDHARRHALLAIHPFAIDRDSVYAFTGGDTVAQLKLPDRVIHLVRIHVEPRVVPRERTVLFSGDVDVDAERFQIVRMRGRFLTVGGKPPLLRRLVQGAVFGAAYVELENAEVHGAYWLPVYQRVELEVATSFTDARSVIRIISHFRDVQARVRRASTVTAASGDTLAPLPHRVSIAPGDSVTRYGGWVEEIGAATASGNADDFDDVAPDALRATGAPRLAFQARRFTDLVHLNRVEGLYTGAAGELRFRDAAPGLTLYATAGYAWSERTARGATALEWRRGRWLAGVHGGRTLVATNDFLSPFDGGATLTMLVGGRDDYDYVDRRTAEVTLARELDARGTVVLRASSGWRRDGAEARRIRGPWFTPGADTFRVNRPVNPGSYWHNTVQVDAGANGDAQYLTTGFGGSLLYERGDGALRWQRIEARFNERADVGAITLIARADAGMVIGHDPPYQMLYELGGERTLPGYDYKEFAGDRAVLARGEVRYHLPLWRAPIRLWRFFLPGLAPAIGVGAQSGWTDAWSGTRAKLPALGSRVTGHPRTTYDFRLYLFSGAVNIGAAYGERWRVVGGLSFD